MQHYTDLLQPIQRIYTMAHLLLRDTVQKFQRDRIIVLSAAMAYFALFSLFPLLLVVLSVIGMVSGRTATTGLQQFQQVIDDLRDVPADLQTDVYQQLVEFADTVISPAVATLIDDTLQHLYTSSVQASVIGVLLLFWTASTIFSQINHTFQIIWEVETHARPRRTFWQMVFSFVVTRLLAFGLVIGTALMLLISLLIHAAIAILRVVAPGLLDESGWDMISFAGAFALLFLIVFLLFRFLPQTRLTWRDVWPGALVTTILITLLVNLSSLIISAGGMHAYGLIGSVLTLLFWLFLSSMTLYTGAIFTAVYTRRYGSQRQPAAHAEH
jgi:membrane protein